MRLSAEQRREMGARGRAWAETDFGWASVARQMYEVYQWILGDGARRSFVIVDSEGATITLQVQDAPVICIYSTIMA